MKNNVKKLLCAALSTAMIAGSIVLPMTASAAEYTPLVEGDNVFERVEIFIRNKPKRQDTQTQRQTEM